jgi:outer membrane receptor protein involved in Fe transport
MKRTTLFFFFCLFCIGGSVHAGDRGKLVGTVRDAQSSDPLIGANVLIQGTTLGASTDENGFFLIPNIPPGIYSLRITFLGYQTLEITEIRVMADVTTEQNARLPASTLQLKDAVIIVAQRPLVQKDRTSTQTIVDGTTVVRELRITSVDDILNLQAGVTKGADGLLHIRGGRSGGVLYQIDGIPVVNPFDHSLATVVEMERVEEMQAHLGTFDAEFGNASDGVVSIITKDGSEQYRIKWQYESPRLNSSLYQKKDWNLDREDVKSLSTTEQELYKDNVRKPDGSSAYDFVSVLDDPYAEPYRIVNMLGTINAVLSGPFPLIPELKFFATGRFRNEDGYLPNGYTMYRAATLKLSYPLTSDITIRGMYDWSQNIRQTYNHQYKYWRWFDSGLDPLGRKGSYPLDKTFSNRQSFQLRQVLSTTSFYDLTVSHLFERNISAIPNRLFTFDPQTGELITTEYIKRLYVDGTEGNFRYGDVRYFTNVSTEQYLAKGNFESILDNHHQLRSGFEFKSHEIFRHRIGMPPLGNLQWFTDRPTEGALYVQDKVEYSFMILKAGVRLDYFDPHQSAYPDPANILRVVNISPGVSEYQAVDKEKVQPHYQISPRIGIAHPISDRTSIHFAYGHFFQAPTFYDLYRNDEVNDILVNDALIGNPGLKPERTVSYELGIQHQISTDWAINATAYSKDISNLIASYYYFVGRDYTIYINADYGRVQGMDITLEKRFSDYYGGRFTYSLMSAMGNQSDPAEGYNSYREDQAHLRPNRNYYLEFDQRHKFNLIVTAKFPDQFGPELFGFFPLELLSCSAIFTSGSGLPYTPTSRSAEESNIVPEPNSARKAWMTNLDVKISRDFKFSDIICAVYFDVTNVFDNLNDVTVWTRTGEAWNQGPTSVFSKDFQSDPENMGPRRSFRAGIILEF